MTKISNQYSLTNILTADLANSRLGINNVSPAYSLDVTGTARVSTSAYLATASGSVGIGTTSPTRLLDVSALGTAYIRASDRTNSVNVDMLAASSGGWIGTQSNHSFQLQTNNTERMRILANGNVGIGTTSPGYALSVNGTAYAVGHIGGYITSSSGYVNETKTITDNGTSYYLRKYTGNANGSSSTIFDITGLNTANGTFADIYAIAQKDATGNAINTNVEVRINGQYMYGIQANGTGANTAICAFKVCRMESSWVIIGTVRT